MASHTRKNLRTSTTIFEYPVISPARKLLDGCISTAILIMVALLAGGIAFLAFNLW